MNWGFNPDNSNSRMPLPMPQPLDAFGARHLTPPVNISQFSHWMDGWRGLSARTSDRSSLQATDRQLY